MIKKLGYLSACALLITAIISCEKDFNDIGSSVVNNTKFDTNFIELEVEVITDEPELDLQSVRADNIAIGALGEYWLGAYENSNAKDIQASIVSQISHNSSFRTTDNDGNNDTIFTLDKVVLKLPYQATASASGNTTTYTLDNIIANTDPKTNIVVKRNESYLNILNPNNPAIQNQFESNFDYIGEEILSESSSYEIEPKATDTIFYYNRIDRFNPSETYKDTVRVIRTVNTQKSLLPFLAIPLDLNQMKTIFWDEFEGDNFATSEAFQNYFRGIKIEAVDNNGSLIPFDLNSTPAPSIDFYYTKSILESDNVTLKDTINDVYTLNLTGIRNSVYKMGAKVTPQNNNFVVQGTAGTVAKMNILDDAKLAELRSNNWLINDASLTFNVDQTISKDSASVPQRLFLYQNKVNNNGTTSPTQLLDAYTEASTFGGQLVLDNSIPNNYTFRITDYISKLLNGEDNVTNDPLILKVYNPTDAPVTNNVLDTNVKTYNWNPRAVTLFDGNTANGAKKAILKIYYSEKK